MRMKQRKRQRESGRRKFQQVLSHQLLVLKANVNIALILALSKTRSFNTFSKPVSYQVAFLQSVLTWDNFKWIYTKCLHDFYLVLSSELLFSKRAWNSHSYAANFELAQDFSKMSTSCLHIFVHFLSSEGFEISIQNRVPTGWTKLLNMVSLIYSPGKNHWSMEAISHVRMKNHKVALSRNFAWASISVLNHPRH